MRPHRFASTNVRFASTLVTAALASALFFATVGAESRARACSCLPGTPESQLTAATAVFEGRVVSIVRRGDPEVGPARLEVTLEVVQTWKAANAERIVVTTASDSAACGVSFEEGRSYLVYAATGDDGALIAGLCGGTARREDSDAAVAAMGAGVTPVDVSDEAPASRPQAAAPGAGGCASCAVGAQRRDAGVPLLTALVLCAVLLGARRRPAVRAVEK
jgi:hypothetical protein